MMKINKKILGVLLCCIIILTSGVFSQSVQASPTTIFVPDNYSTIQEAIDAASSGDTIIVRNGTYTENVHVNKDNLIIQSENGAINTIVQAADPNDHVFEVRTDYVTINGFTIRYANGKESQYISGTYLGSAGIYLKSATSCTIINNNILENTDGIFFESSVNISILENEITWNNTHGVWWIHSDGNIISGNNITNSLFGIWAAFISDDVISENIVRANESDAIALSFSSNNKILENTIATNGSGISLFSRSYGNLVSGNYITACNNWGIALSEASNNTINRNTIMNSTWRGLRITSSTTYSSNNNVIYANNFISNNPNVDSETATNTWHSPEEITYTYGDNAYTNYLGNYWSNYTGSDANGDGIGDTPYIINSDADNNALMEPFENYEIGVPPQCGAVSQPQVIVTPNSTSANAMYTIQFDTTLPLAAVDTITITFPPETSLIGVSSPPGHIVNAGVSNDGGISLVVPALVTQNMVVIGVPDEKTTSGPAHMAVTISNNVFNPTVPSDYTLWVNTSQETIPVESAPYAITIPGVSIADFIGSPTQGTTPLPVKFTDKSTGSITSWSWDFGDGGTSTEQNPSHTYNTIGTYGVSLTVSGPGGTNAATKNNYINVGSLPISEQPQLKAPWVGIAKITQGNNGATSHHDYGTWDNTYAIDVALSLGTDVLAPADGIVKYVDDDAAGSGGKELAIEHTGTTGKKYVTVYLHLSEIFVTTGNSVLQGQVVAKSGDTSNGPGGVKPHLHFHIWSGTGSYDSHTMPIERLMMKQVGVDNDFREYDARTGALDDGIIGGKSLESNNVAITISQLRDSITRRLQMQITYPLNFLDEPSFGGVVTSWWTSFTSWITQTGLTQKYNELYWAGVDYGNLRTTTLILANKYLNAGDTINAQKFIQKSDTFGRLSNMSFEAANDVFINSLDAAETLAQGIKDGCETAVTFGLHVVNPAAANVVDYIYIVTDGGVEYALGNEDQAVKDTVVRLATKGIFDEVKFTDLGNRTLSDWIANQTGGEVFPTLSKLISSQEAQFALTKIVKETVIEITDSAVQAAVNSIIKETQNTLNSQSAMLHSPGQLTAHDSLDRITGLIGKQVKNEIPQSVYYSGSIIIFFSSNPVVYDVTGTDSDTYGLGVKSIVNSIINEFNAIDVPIIKSSVHQYTIDWIALSQGQAGVTIQIDSNGDGIFEKSVTSDGTLTHDEFVLQTDTTPPVSIASPIAMPDANGWNSEDVTVSLAAADEAGGSGVNEIHYTINNSAKTVVSGNSASIIISNSGVNVVTYFAIDNAGNIEASKSLTVKICDYYFEDSIRGTKLYIVEKDKTFQFITRDKDFGIKKAINMKVIDLSRDPCVQYDRFGKKWNIDDKKFDIDNDLRPWFKQFKYNNRPDKIILINYQDKELKLTAVIVDGKEDSCMVTAKDLKTKKVYLLIDTPKLKSLWPGHWG